MKSIIFILFVFSSVVAGQALDDDYEIGQSVIVVRDGERLTRRIVGRPESKVVSADLEFVLRGQSTSVFTSSSLKAWFRGPSPLADGEGFIAQENTEELLRMEYSEYHAAPRPRRLPIFPPRRQPACLVRRRNAHPRTGADSREWGPVHAREFLRIVDPGEQL